ncbi:hypothetical protein [Halobacillus naozhouensis]|uniref:LPS export ABC transporter periplasmic protein LptC n=1 Tax=Halobacillus naozhouensis TaxID=554880 RepID=A0ABY8J192_9BACI|nr:hypothetical protein [Halobacillus naozhouensis]WFT75189.1 hypothetical protein P9989_01915 [Halobacillus naozhouensis]
MNDLLDYKLKKMDHNVKYRKVPMKEQDIDEMVQQVTNHQSKKPLKNWIKLTFPMPAVAVIALLCFQVTNQPAESEVHKAAPLSERSLVTELKAQQSLASTSSQDQTVQPLSGTKWTDRKQGPTMIRQTYVMFEEEMYVQTGNRVEKSKLHQVIGTVKPGNASEQHAKQAFFPETDIYSIEGNDSSEKIAIHSRRSTGIGTSSISQQGFFIFKKQQPLPAAQ